MRPSGPAGRAGGLTVAVHNLDTQQFRLPLSLSLSFAFSHSPYHTTQLAKSHLPSHMFLCMHMYPEQRTHVQKCSFPPLKVGCVVPVHTLNSALALRELHASTDSAAALGPGGESLNWKSATSCTTAKVSRLVPRQGEGGRGTEREPLHRNLKPSAWKTQSW